MPMPELQLDERIQKSLQSSYEQLEKQGEIVSKERLKECYALFRERFGPERLRSLDGQPLLNLMHAHGNRESLVYWLEFKNDEEFPAAFGSIAGGSALKFGLFKRKDSGEWVTGSAQNQVTISVDAAVVIARKHRDQLIAGTELIAKVPGHGSDDEYLQLQKLLDSAAPDVSGMAWGHKYFHLLFPETLDDYHNENYQRYYLTKLLQLPLEYPGLYVSAGRFVQLAAKMGWTINQLTTVLNQRYGKPARYWRIGTRLGATTSIWSMMRDGNVVAIGWDRLSDLKNVAYNRESKEKLSQRLIELYGDTASVASRKAGEIMNFVAGMSENDLVLAADGERILGIGCITGPYIFESNMPNGAPHRRPVEWLSLEEWKLPVPEGLRTTVWPMKKDPKNFIAVEKHILEPVKIPRGRPVAVTGRAEKLEGIPGRVQTILERKGQVILYGPPGTGKTYWARLAAQELASLAAFRRHFTDLSTDEQITIKGGATEAGLIRFCTFHPGYGYEDFLEGYRPLKSEAGQLVFERRNGIFKQICHDAGKDPQRTYFLVIDEINRGDIPRIFGELLTLLEKDKRGMEVILPLSGDRFAVPSNLNVIGTMNTADRSIALLDTALRRRFGFVELMPDATTLGNVVVGESIPLGQWLTALNERIRKYIGRDARNLQVGHAYLMKDGRAVDQFSDFSQIMADDIVPLLEEYCYEDYNALTQILGKGLIDQSQQRIREELFSPSRRDELVQALLAPSPDIATSREAVAQPTTAEETDESVEPEELEK